MSIDSATEVPTDIEHTVTLESNMVNLFYVALGDRTDEPSLLANDQSRQLSKPHQFDRKNTMALETEMDTNARSNAEDDYDEYTSELETDKSTPNTSQFNRLHTETSVSTFRLNIIPSGRMSLCRRTLPS
jgi:hypothetical protein